MASRRSLDDDAAVGPRFILRHLGPDERDDDLCLFQPPPIGAPAEPRSLEHSRGGSTTAPAPRPPAAPRRRGESPPRPPRTVAAAGNAATAYATESGNDSAKAAAGSRHVVSLVGRYSTDDKSARVSRSSPRPRARRATPAAAA